MRPKKLKVHFIGIGGIGVSALAKYYLKTGHQVTGSDLVFSEITETLEKLGVKIFIGKHKTKNVTKNVDLVVYTPAAKPDNPEILKAKVLRIKLLSYPEALGELTKSHFTIAVSGTHGKSTTTAMIGLLLAKAGLDPTVIVGTKLKEFGNSNCRVGESKYLVIEADEWQASFLNYWPKIIVLTNIEAEHLDYYKNLRNILKTYKEYTGRLQRGGVLVVNEDDKNIEKVVNIRHKIQKFSLEQKVVGKLREILKVPGEHNIANALAALTVARVLKIPDKTSFKALSEYKGSWRRFEEHAIKLKAKPCTLISDYGHHPTEIRATLKTAREKYPKREIWCIFQPHQYQRTYYLFNDFVKTFREAPVDKLIITDIYDVAGREEKKIKEKVSSEKLVKKINKSWAIYLPINKIIDYLEENLADGEKVVIVMGAGDIYKLAVHLTEKGRRKKID